MNDIDKIMAKIKKLLALSRSPNPNEAASALRMAQELMAEHRVGQADINSLDIAEEPVKTACRENPPRHEAVLIYSIAEAFGCRHLYHMRGYQCTWLFIGLRHRAQVAAYIGQVLMRKLRAARAGYIKSLYRVRSKYRKTQRADEFCRAWVGAVTEKLPAFAGADEGELNAIACYVQKSHPKLTDISSINRPSVNDADYYNGAHAGRGVHLQHGVGVDPRSPLLLGGKKNG